MLQNKKVLIGVCGSIAAYKIAFLTRLLVKQGVEVKIVMTTYATKFISALTLSTLSKHQVYIDFENEDNKVWNNHVELGLWADVLLVAPTTANTLAKMANGICDNLLIATYLSAKCPVIFAPAMDLDMWTHPSTQNNIKLLKSYGNEMIDVGDGELASGLVGKGRMAEPEDIVAHLENHFTTDTSFAGQTVLITAGPTYEAIDPVRFIGNRSTGKMGLALAEAFAKRGAAVELVLGPSKLSVADSSITVTRVQSAAEMYEAAVNIFPKATIAIGAAAVADYSPKTVAEQKIKKSGDDLKIELSRTKDIIAALGKQKNETQILVGFALETNNELENAKSKLERKNLDLIVLNSLQDKGAGFGHDTNKVSIIGKDNKISNFELKSKQQVAVDIINEIEKIISK